MFGKISTIPELVSQRLDQRFGGCCHATGIDALHKLGLQWQFTASVTHLHLFISLISSSMEWEELIERFWTAERVWSRASCLLARATACMATRHRGFLRRTWRLSRISAFKSESNCVAQRFALIARELENTLRMFQNIQGDCESREKAFDPRS